jgi:hypothetical protein
VSNVHEIERAIENLTRHDLQELYDWLDQHCPQPIDDRIANDLATGRLDNLILGALDDEKTGRVRSLSPLTNHKASTSAWRAYLDLPQAIRDRADKQFSLLKNNPQHPSLQFERVGQRVNQEIWSARVSLNYRALAIKRSNGFLRVWIGDHNSYDMLIR